MHTDLGIAIQQYGFAAIFWLTYSTLGTVSLYILILLLNFLFCPSLQDMHANQK